MTDTAAAGEATARIIHVAAGATEGDGSEGAPYGSIQQALDAAGPGDTVLVGEGTYTENLVFRNGGTTEAPIRLMAEGDASLTRVLPDDPAKDTIRVAGADNIVIEGFSLYGSDDASRQVIQIHAKDGNTDPATNIVVANNIINRGEGDGIKASKSVDISIVDNTITGGGLAESAIDFVGVTGGRIEGNDIRDIPGIAVMLKGGTSDVDVFANTILDVGKNAIEVGGYSPQQFYPPGFLEGGNTYEARDITVANNLIDGVANTALRVIAAQNVVFANNVVENAAKIVTIDDSAKFHAPWYADKITFAGNDFDRPDWLIDRSAAATVTIEEGAPSFPEFVFVQPADGFVFKGPTEAGDGMAGEYPDPPLGPGPSSGVVQDLRQPSLPDHVPADEPLIGSYEFHDIFL